MKLDTFTKFTWGVLGWTLLVILWGALVRATGSGAGCGSHWPTCNGEIIPQPKAVETAIEFTHRMMSGAAMLMVLAMLIGGFRLYPKGHLVRRGVVLSSFFILLEAMLGAGLVLLELVGDNDSGHRAIAVAVHLLNTFLLVGVLTLTVWWASGGRDITLREREGWTLWLGLGLAGVIVIGMSGAVTALGDTLFPSESIASTLAEQADPSAHFLVRLRIYHPIIAVLVGGYSLWLAGSIREKFEAAAIRRLAWALTGLILAQLAAGAVNVLLLAPIWMQLVHLLLADLIWIAYVLLSANILSVNEA
jgi:heme A synthase